jgi:virginiamycin B lyase
VPGGINRYIGSSYPNSITAGPDGAIWYTVCCGGPSPNSIGRTTIGGNFTRFTLTAAPAGITPGPDGALWFTESGANKLGRITTSGIITEYPVTGAPWWIARGPDDKLWFTEPSAKKIGRLDPAAAVPGTSNGLSEFAVQGSPTGITAGPDGALWLTENSPAKVGRITTGGTVTDEVTSSGSSLAGIATGTDGALWFGAGSIGRVTTAFSFNYFTSPGTDTAANVTTGPDGALWFTTNPAIVRVTPEVVQQAQLVVTKVVSPQSDPGLFNLQVDGRTVKDNVRSGGTSYTQYLDPGSHTVGETAASGTSLSNYSSQITCTDNGSTVASGSGTTLSVPVASSASRITCTITNTRNP